MASASGYNHHRFARAVLKKSRKWEPSLVVQLYPSHWRFENSVGLPGPCGSWLTSRLLALSRWSSGSLMLCSALLLRPNFDRPTLDLSGTWNSLARSLAQPMTFQYSGPMSPFLLALRAQVIPAALIPFLYDIRPPVSFVDGCLVVEIQDSRKTPEVRSRVVMRPAPETVPQTVSVMLERKGEEWDENMALELESRIMVSFGIDRDLLSCPWWSRPICPPYDTDHPPLPLRLVAVVWYAH